MAIEMKVPPVGESITEVTVGAWHKKEGDSVKRDEVLCELESDKASFEFPAEADGVLHIMAQEGDVLPIGAVLCTIEAAGCVQRHGSGGSESGSTSGSHNRLKNRQPLSPLPPNRNPHHNRLLNPLLRRQPKL
jgi:pyruvate/2-oxoglutarate dehydrogenase complex dihydrolipoamide acyltransferase (E2) component